MNLSSQILTGPQKSVLTKGLGYVPSTPDIPDYSEGTTRLSRTLRLRHFFRDQDSLDRSTKLPPFRKRSTWQPPPADTLTEEYLRDLPSKLSDMITRDHKANLRRSERAALQQLAQNHELVIRKADKGSCVVVEDRKDYIRDGLAHLADRDVYVELQDDPTQELCKAINGMVRGVHNKGHISDDMRDYLYLDPPKTRTQQAYFLKKLHKGPREVRPIVSGVSGPTEKLSAFMDYFMKPLVEDIPSYLRDSAHLIRALELETPPADCIMATVDVRALYPSIPQQEGINSTIKALYDSNPKRDDVPFPAGDLLCIIHIFEFDGTIYQQKRGTAMGTKIARHSPTCSWPTSSRRLSCPRFGEGTSTMYS